VHPRWDWLTDGCGSYKAGFLKQERGGDESLSSLGVMVVNIGGVYNFLSLFRFLSFILVCVEACSFASGFLGGVSPRAVGDRR
jgi:hypothetical protein